MGLRGGYAAEVSNNHKRVSFECAIRKSLRASSILQFGMQTDLIRFVAKWYELQANR